MLYFQNEWRYLEIIIHERLVDDIVVDFARLMAWFCKARRRNEKNVKYFLKVCTAGMRTGLLQPTNLLPNFKAIPRRPGLNWTFKSMKSHKKQSRWFVTGLIKRPVYCIQTSKSSQQLTCGTSIFAIIKILEVWCKSWELVSHWFSGYLTVIISFASFKGNQTTKVDKTIPIQHLSL